MCNWTLVAVEENIKTWICEIATIVGTPQSTAAAILTKHKFKQFIGRKIQAVIQNDPKNYLHSQMISAIVYNTYISRYSFNSLQEYLHFGK